MPAHRSKNAKKKPNTSTKTRQPVVAEKPKTQKRKKRLSFKKKLFAIAILLFVIGVGWLLYILRDLPSPQQLNAPENFPVSTQIFDRNGKLLYEIYSDENRIPIQLSDLPPHVYQASIAIEDQHFYRHFGFDFIGIMRAVRNMLRGESTQGGSTITQQLVKTALLTREQTLERKAKEAVLTIATELLYSKDQILEMYLNHIPYGGTAWGIEAAAQTYFDKPAKDLSIAEAALLAGLPQAPSRYSPFQSDPQRSKNRQSDVIRRMQADGYISAEQADEARNTELKFALSTTNIRAPHFVFFVKDQLVEKYGLEKVERGGLRVTTTLDLDLQEQAQASVTAEINSLTRYKVGNGAAMVTKPDTGEILAMIGSKNYFDATGDGKVNVTIEERQPGSSIKPLNLVTAFELKKQTPASMLLDIPTCFQNTGQPLYCPRNYDGGFHGPVQQRFALGNSYNIPAVKTTYLNGTESFIATASAMGITTWNDPSKYGISLGLGAGEVRMIDMAQAFGVLANQGVKTPLVSILEVKDYQGKTLEEIDLEERKQQLKDMTDDEEIEEYGDLKRVLHRAPAYLVSHILLDNSARAGAFGTNSQLVIKDQVVSVKTGTTNNLKDNWTVGYTPEYLTIVWVGNNDGSSMNQSLVSGVTGAAPIWNDIMSMVLKDKESIWPEQPTDIVSKTICSASGLLPNGEGGCATRNEFFWKGTEPTETDQSSKEIWIDPTTGLPPKEGQSLEGIELQLQRHTVYSDPFTREYCLDCTRPTNEEGKVTFERYIVPANFSLTADKKSQTEETTPEE